MLAFTLGQAAGPRLRPAPPQPNARPVHPRTPPALRRRRLLSAASPRRVACCPHLLAQ